MKPTIQPILILVDKLASRIRRQRMFDSLVTGITYAMLFELVLLALLQGGWISQQAFFKVGAFPLVIPIVLVIYAGTRPLDKIKIAQRIDDSEGLYDRLSTALAFHNAGASTPFSQAQLADALRCIDPIDLSKVAPTRRPVDLLPLLVLLLLAIGIVWIPRVDFRRPLPPPLAVTHRAILDATTLTMEKKRLNDIKAKLAEINDKATEQLVQEIDQLLQDVENKEISEREFLERLDKIKERYFSDEAKRSFAANQKVEDALQEAARQIVKEEAKTLEKEPEIKALLEAYKEKNKEKAAEALDALSKKLEGLLDEESAERMAELLKKFADKIDPYNPKLRELYEKNKELFDKLAEKLNLKSNKKSGDSAKNDGQNSDGAKKREEEQLKDAEEKMNTAKKELEHAQQSQSADQLQQLKREIENLANQAQDQSQQNQAHGEQGQQNQAHGEQGQQNQAQGEQGQQNQAHGEQGQQNQAHGEQGQQNQAQGEQGQQNQAQGEQGQQKSPTKKLKQQAERSQKSQEIEQLRNQVEEQLDDLQESIQRSTNREEAGNQEGKKEIEEYLRRASGEEKPQSSGKDYGNDDGSEMLGEKSGITGKSKKEKVDLKVGKDGSTRSEIIKSASEQGFASRAYKEVYTDYENNVDDVMEKEKVPSGYRYYVKKYFQLIKPNED